MDSRQAQAIILSRSPVGEKDLVVKVLTREGLHSWWVRGGQNSQRRFLGVLEPSHYIQAAVKKASGLGDRWYLEEARCLESFSGIRTQYQRVAVAMTLLGFVSRLPQGNLPQGEFLFLLLGKSLRVCERGEPERLPYLWVSFMAYFLYFEGVLDRDDPLCECLKFKVGDWIPSDSNWSLSDWIQHARNLVSLHFHQEFAAEV